MRNEYGYCCYCGGELHPVWFTEEEYKVTPWGYQYRTGRVRRAVSHLVCDNCLSNHCVDDTFDGLWRDKE